MKPPENTGGYDEALARAQREHDDREEIITDPDLFRCAVCKGLYTRVYYTLAGRCCANCAWEYNKR